MSGFILIFAVLATMAFFGFGVQIYNSFIGLRNQLERAWANIDVILKQRFDEVPQLIQVIEQYAQYESGIIDKIAKARADYGAARSVKEKIDSSQSLGIALSGVMALGEAYPELKANQNFTQLQGRISHFEETLADRRETYNDIVSQFNSRIDQFPDVFVARFLGYERQNLFQVEEREKALPSLKMNLPKVG